jgi:very-short-patch-repair endonuclease
MAKLSRRMKSMYNWIKRQEYKIEDVNLRVKKNSQRMGKKMTAPEKQFKKMLTELKVVFESQKIVGTKIYDFYIPSINMLVEIDGDYYHANPEIYEGKESKMQKKNIENDVYKDTLALGLGYKIERVWESDLKKNYSSVKNKFKKLLGLK